MSSESEKYKNIYYINPERKFRDRFDQKLENISAKMAKVETAGSEKNIPANGRLIIGWMPHSGIIEPVLIDEVTKQIGRNPLVVIAKKESTDLPSFIRSNRRFIFVDRDNPAPSTFRAVNSVLEAPTATIATALEGTRYSNPNDPNDVLTLGESLPGLMRTSFDTKTPIMGVAVLGSEKILPDLDKTLQNKGVIEAVKLVINTIKNPQDVQIRFLPPYTDHLKEGFNGKNGENKSEFIQKHNKKFTLKIIDEILKVDPDYPLGFYEKG